MRDFFNRFTFQEAKLTASIWVFALVIWGLIVACAVSSIVAQPFTKRQRQFWLILVIGLPIFGLLIYLPFSIQRDELPTAFLLRGSAKDRKIPRRPSPLDRPGA